MKPQFKTLFSAVVVALTLTGIWLPEVRHNWVATTNYPPHVLNQLRTAPDDRRMTELSRLEFDFPVDLADPGTVISEANQILHGRWYNFEFGTMTFTFPFDIHDLTSGWPTQQLHFAALDHVNVLMQAYEASGNPRYLAGARDVIDGWAKFERSTWLGAGYLWNDHAMAQRLLTLTKYWRAMRHSPLLNDKSLQLLAGLVGRTGRMLMRGDQFTARTNHGLMQSMALLHIAAAFPALPESSMFRATAIARVRLQLPYYQSAEGVVLEHSPGYHELGVRLLHTLVSYRTEIGEDIYNDIAHRLRVGCDFALDLLRPDATLPMIGDTTSLKVSLPCAAPPAAPGDHSAEMALNLYPLSGFASIRYAPASSAGAVATTAQLAVTWSKFASLAHKHDDELSIASWAVGLPMVTSTGYWPYGEGRDKLADGWRGSNAPFVDQEVPAARRESELLASASDGHFGFLHMRRVNRQPDATIDRQLLSLGPGQILVVDLASSPAAQSQHTIWTLYPGWNLQAGQGAGTYIARHKDTQSLLGLSFASPTPLQLSLLRGSNAPFGGWVALDPAPEWIRPASSVEVVAPAGAPVVTLWSLSAATDAPRVSVAHWNGVSSWSICLDSQRCELRVTREGKQLNIQAAGGTVRLALNDVPAYAVARAAINSAYHAAVARFPYWRDFQPWRIRFTLWIAGLFVLSELVFWLCLRKASARRGRVQFLHSVAPLMWALAGATIVFWYFSA